MQGVTDCLAQYGVKKGQAQRSLDNLVADAEAGIVCKVALHVAGLMDIGSQAMHTHVGVKC